MDPVSATPPPAAQPLLATKLSPPRLRPGLVPRPDLVARLNQGVERQVTLVSAPAGFGKTTLVGAWAAQASLAVAWLTLEEADNDPARWLRYLVAALRQVDPAIGQAVHGALETLQPPAPDVVIAALVNDLLARLDPLALALDDFHTVDHPAIHAAARSLVTHQPPALRLIFVTREDPPLPLARLRGRGELVEIRAHDLRFSPAEVAAFLSDVVGLSLDPATVAALDQRIEGWVAGLQLAALSLQRQANPADLITALSSSHHFILSYLTEEALNQLPPNRQSFLLDTSILSRLTGPLCDAVTERDDSEAVLAQLYTSNAFVIPLDAEQRWYRYHPLFAELLRHQLQRRQPERVPLLHARASAWFDAHAAPEEAVEHAFAANDYPRVVDLLERHARSVVLQGYAQTVEGWLRRLPPAWRVTGPRANLAFAWSLLLRGRPAEIEPYLADAETAAGQAGPTGAAIRAEALALRAGLVSLRGDTERAVELARQAVDLAPADDPYIQGMARFCLATAYNYAGRVVEAIATYQTALPLCRAAGATVAAMLAVANLTVLRVVRGRLRDAAALCREVIEAAEQADTPPSPPLATVYLAYSELLYEWNDLTPAQALATRWLDLGQRGGHVAAVAYGSVVLSRIRLAQGDLPGAGAAVAQAEALLGRGMPAWVAPHVVAQRVDVALAQDDPAQAAETLARSGVSPDSPPSHTREVVHLAYLRLALHEARAGTATLAPALDLAGRVLDAAEAGGRTGRVIDILAHRALLYHAQGDTPQAHADLVAALAQAEPEGYVRLFVNHGAAMGELLEGLGIRDWRLETGGLEIRDWGLEMGDGRVERYRERLLSALGAPSSERQSLPSSPTPSPPPSTPFPAREGGRGGGQPPIEPLTERELEVLRLIAEGLTYQEIAQRLVVSVNTVRFHVKGVYGKLGVDRRAAAVERARALGLL